jgi:hypothetical protein
MNNARCSKRKGNLIVVGLDEIITTKQSEKGRQGVMKTTLRLLAIL